MTEHSSRRTGFDGSGGAAARLIIGKAREVDATIDRLTIGLTWTSCRAGNELGLAMSPGIASRVLPWPGTIAGRRVSEVACWLESWDPFEATVGLASANAAINVSHNALLQSARTLEGAGNLAVFQHYRPKLGGKKIVVIGRYPGLEEVLQGLDATVIERNPGGGDLPDSAAEFVLPEADWVFVTATSLINKTFYRLVELSRHAVTVLMGPSTPWLAEWAEFGVDIVAGVRVVDANCAECIAAEGGGTRLFGSGVRYAVAELR